MAKVKGKVLRIKLTENQAAAVSHAHQIFNAAREQNKLDYLSEDNFALEMLLQASVYLHKQYQQALVDLKKQEEEANKILHTDGTITPAEV